ncbi:hypothetical protein LTT66_20360 [Nocardia gipuzkoensis]|uniref:hypothetical protein n=1 Tax=Nocardia gipuzkoensis TaxID=2749991 RepID=UPI001E63CE22|nr:hypothetical protein [Nocardia gipuzkoensis]UGT65685.1 hypothetical protein LTT66_20360 [Nocardia gipuzkoensis]
MKGGGRIALGVGIGYLLGRTRKMRFALSLAGAAMAKRSTGTPGALLERGTSLLKSSPELERITDTVRGELLGAARAAAVTAASNRLDALNTRLQQGSTLLADEDRRGSRETDSEADEYEDEASEDQRASADDDLEDEYEEDEGEADQGADEDEDDTERPAARRARRPSTAGRRAASSRSADRSAGSADRKPSGSRGRRSRTDTDAAPVRRTRR